MNLQPNYSTATDTGLHRAIRNLINSEPHQAHSILECWDEQCSSCQEWRKWAGQLRQVNREINARKVGR